jgi:hypothetical protein
MRPGLRKIVRVATLCTVGSALSVVATTAPAHASPYYPRCAPVGTAGNEICIRFINNNTGVDMGYFKRAGNPVTVRFSYQSGSFRNWDGGWFTAVRGIPTTPYTYAWNGTNPGSCITGYLHVSDGSQYSTGQLCR